MSYREQLFKQANRESEALVAEEALLDAMTKDSVRGDPSLVPVVAQYIGSQLVHQENVSANHRIWLALVLAKIMKSPEACRIVAGVKGGGAPKKSFDAIKIALEVMRCIVEEDAKSVASALEATAEKMHVSVDTAKLHWQAQQDAVWLVYGSEIREHMGFPDLASAVKAMTSNVRSKARGK